MANSTLHNLNAASSMNSTDELYLVLSPFGSGDDRRITFSNFQNSITALGTLTGLTVSGSSSLAGLTTSGAVSVGSTLGVTGASSFTGDVVANHNLTVNNNLSVNSNVNFPGSVYFSTSGVLSMGGTDTMTVNGAAVTTKIALHPADSATESAIELHQHSATAGRGAVAYFARTRGTAGAPTVVQSGDSLGQIDAVGYDGTDYATAASIEFEVDGTPGSNDMPGRILFKTSADGAQTLTTALTLKNDQSALFAGTVSVTTSLLTPSTTFNLVNATATTVNFAGAATTMAIGASTALITVPGNIISTNNAIAASSNAATVPITHRLSTVTNDSAAGMTITLTTASAVDGQLLMVRILDFSAVAQTITWVNTENSTVTAPATSNGSTTLPLTVGFQFNSATTKWRCIASA